MTQYTSFVAVDKVKRADGKLVTVKQPLPLPEGVSDSAVGNGAGGLAPTAPRARMQVDALSLSTGAAMAPAAEETSPQVVEREVAVGGDESADKPKDGPGAMAVLTVEEIKGDLAREAVDQALRPQLMALRKCYVDAGLGPNEAVFRIKVDAQGQVVEVIIASGPKDVSVRACLKDIIKKVRFSRPRRLRPKSRSKCSSDNPQNNKGARKGPPAFSF